MRVFKWLFLALAVVAGDVSAERPKAAPSPSLSGAVASRAPADRSVR